MDTELSYEIPLNEVKKTNRQTTKNNAIETLINGVSFILKSVVGKLNIQVTHLPTNPYTSTSKLQLKFDIFVLCFMFSANDTTKDI